MNINQELCQVAKAKEAEEVQSLINAIRIMKEILTLIIIKKNLKITDSKLALKIVKEIMKIFVITSIIVIMVGSISKKNKIPTLEASLSRVA